MSKPNVLIVPGYKGSGDAHWQTWIENHTLSKRVEQDWESPILARWADNVRDAIDASVGSIWIVAHSFGCLASISAAIDRPDRIVGLMLVAPADPERFTLAGVRDKADWNPTESIRALIPVHKLPFPSLVIASDDDPWMKLTTVQLWSECWGSRLLILKSAGHINIASGYGPWPLGLSLLKEFQSAYQNLPLGDVYFEDFSNVTRGRGGQVARTRHQTRRLLGI
jgi:predicted alpha/beta hydrolase family esterase